jgi:transposase-like protein
VSALELQRVLGLGSYETAWTWLHKLRRAMVRPGRDCLSGVVEVDEAYVGGVEKGKWGREVESKAIVAIAAEEDGEGVGRIRLRRIADVSAASLLPFVREAVAPGTHVHTDGWKGYASLREAGFKHRVSVIAASADPAHVVMPRVHRAAACSSAGCSARTSAASRRTSSTTTSTSSPPASIGAGRRRGGYCSIASQSRPWRSLRRPTAPSLENPQIWAFLRARVSEGDIPLKRYGEGLAMALIASARHIGGVTGTAVRTRG